MAQLEARVRAWPRLAILAVALFVVIVVGVADYFTSPELSFSIFYILPISFAAWLAGRRSGAAVAAASAASWFIADIATHAYSLPAFAVWNGLVRLAVYLVIALALSELQSSRQKEEALRHFIVHDMRNHLTNVQTGLQILERDPTSDADPGQARVIRIALISCRRMFTLIDSLLDLGRLEHGRMPVRAQDIDGCEIVRGAMEYMALSAQQSRITLAPECSPGACRVHADGALTTRILVNLLGNAIKFSPPGSTVTVAVAPAGSGRLAFSVRDEGWGIPPEWATRVFDKYAQVDLSRNGQSVGTGNGLGLAFCKLAVEAQRGRIWIEPAPPAGTVVKFTLPLAPVER